MNDLLNWLDDGKKSRSGIFEDFYVDLSLFLLIFYFTKEAKWIKTDGRLLFITDQHLQFLYDLLVCGKIYDDQTESDGDDVARNWYKRMIIRYPQMKDILIRNHPQDEDSEN